MWIFLACSSCTLFAELVANDHPILIRYDGGFYTPFLVSYPETEFGGEFPTEADYTDTFVLELIEEKGWILWPPIRYRYDTTYNRPGNARPIAAHGAQLARHRRPGPGRVARMIYGFRVSVLFGLLLTIFSSIVGVAVGAIQGYFGGMTDLFGQRLIEIWAGMPTLFMLIIMASIVTPSFWLAARTVAAVQLDGAGGRGARRSVCGRAISNM